MNKEDKEIVDIIFDDIVSEIDDIDYYNDNDIPDYAKSIGDAYDEAYEEVHSNKG